MKSRERSSGLAKPRARAGLQQRKRGAASARDISRDDGRTRTVAGLAAVFALALVVRLAVLHQLSPLTLFQHPLLDSGEYLEWARRIAAGDFSWPAYAPHGPGYPFFLGGLLWLFGGSLDSVRIAQAIVGAAACVLVADIGRRIFSRTAGVVAGVVCALYGPLVLNDISLLAEAVLLPLLILVMWLLVLRRRLPVRTILLGALTGLAILVRPTAIALLVPCAVDAWRSAGPTPRRLARLVVVLAACAVVVLPVALENRAKSGSLMIQGYGGMNLFLGNDPAGTGLATARLGAGWDRLAAAAIRDGVTISSDQDAYYLRKTVRAVAAHPGQWFRLIAGKALWLVQADEVRDTHSYYFFTDASMVLRWLPGFGAVFPLAIVGLVIAFRRSDGRPWLLISYLLAFALTCIVFVVGSRYRLPLVPALVVLASLPITTVIDRGRARPFAAAIRPAVGYGFLLAACIVLANLRTDPGSHNLSEEWALTGRALMLEGRCTEAVTAFQQALQADRRSGYAWDGLGACAFEANDLDQADRAFRNAVAADADNAEAHYHIGVVQERRGAYESALEQYRRAMQISPLTPSFMRASARVLMATGALPEAAAWYGKALSLQPDDA
jgi:4-amino-4-deoxy-L-arabinose transferase-like glycosyltransferase